MPNVETARVPRGQLSLFARPSVRDVLERHNLKLYSARTLHYDGWLSFEPTPDRLLHPAEEAELDFLFALYRLAGSRGMASLLAGLTAPYAYRLDLLELDVRQRAWRVREPQDEAADLALPWAG